MNYNNSKRVFYFVCNTEEFSGSIILLRTLLNGLQHNGHYLRVVLLSGKRQGVFKGFDCFYVDEVLGCSKIWISRLLFVRRRLVDLFVAFLIFGSKLKSLKPVIIYNTITVFPAKAPFFLCSIFKIPHFVWVHESKYLLNLHGVNLTNNVSNRTNFLFSSQLVKSDLESFLLKKSHGKLSYIGAGIEMFPKGGTSVRNKILISGYLDWNKGSDLILPLIVMTISRNPSIAYKIVISKRFSTAVVNFTNDLERLGLNSSNVEIHYEINNIDEVYNDVQLTLILSRNESLSLVALESLGRDIPFLFFNGCGGPEEIVGNVRLFSVPYLDLLAMSDKILDFYSNELIYKKALSTIDKQMYLPTRLCERFLNEIV
jgi:glycosyltransferase involved in cell wall biosynthesis